MGQMHHRFRVLGGQIDHLVKQTFRFLFLAGSHLDNPEQVKGPRTRGMGLQITPAKEGSFGQFA